ncbi:hypothetical protein OGAPHI_000990 [Ogataea philodendri]|uniref:Major facilitator superfamily (MFS) profile domain-containing protein n=1 Tax=Ogataea philodendri TaxID=1378263 RepID=A0A9P8T9N3_9ASCO|nr:uncharacterized protein OGAPHI_000990 [Ogataea philodendri]KAH3670475.1 hypothetical protein OGAPHI_000990 [Ogataea philodendri]
MFPAGPTYVQDDKRESLELAPLAHVHDEYDSRPMASSSAFQSGKPSMFNDKTFQDDTVENSTEVFEEDPLETVEYPDGGWKAYSTVAASLLGLICAFGIMNSTGAIESYLEKNTLKTIPTTTISWIFAIYTFLSFGGNLFSGALFDTYGAKKVAVPGAVLLCGGLLATASCTQVWQFVLSFGVCCGIGCALLMAPMVSCIAHFFKQKRGLALGIAMPGASIGGVIWPLVCNSLYPKIGFPWTMRVLGFIFMGILTTSCLLINDRLDEISNQTSSKSSVWAKVKESIDFKTLKDPVYLILVGALFMNEFSLILCFTYIPSYALDKGYSESFSLIALTVVNASGVGGRYLPSHLSDAYGRFNMILAMSAIATFAVLVLWLPFGKYKPAFVIFCIVYGFATAATLALTPLCTSQISKAKDFGKRYGTAYFFVSFGNLICIPIGIALTKTSAGYNGMLAFAGAGSFCSTLLFVLARYKLAKFTWKAV